MHKLRCALLIAVSLLTLTSIAQNGSVNSPGWLKGTWQVQAGSNAMFESWQQLDENTYTGKGYMINAKDTVVFEELRLQQIGPHWCYIATVSGKKPVLFAHTQMASDRMVFENAEHDFPQRIHYQLHENGTLTATVEGRENDKERREVFEMKKLPK